MAAGTRHRPRLLRPRGSEAMSARPNEDVLYDSRGTYGNHFIRRRQQSAEALAANATRYAQTKATAPLIPNHQHPTMNQTIQKITQHLANLKDQKAAIAATSASDIARAEQDVARTYQAMIDAIADGRDPSAEAQANQTAKAALQTARLQADVGTVRVQRLTAEIEDTTDDLANEEGALRRSLIAALERARNDLECEMMTITERRFEAEVRGLHINARLHQLKGLPGHYAASIPGPYSYPVLRPVTLSHPAPAPVFPELHRKDVMQRIAAEVAQIGAEL